jgi:hypothetical protein
MSSGHALTDPALLAALESQRRLRVEDYHRMVAAGVFFESASVGGLTFLVADLLA